MPIANNANQKTDLKRQPAATSDRKPRRKAPGTRLGSLDDWREGSSKKTKPSSPHGHAIRDGR